MPTRYLKDSIIISSGWIPSGETWTYSSADSPTFLATVSGDKRTKYSKGMKLKLEQEQSLTGYWTFDSDATSQVGSFTPTNIGTPTYTAGKFGNALTLDGSTDAISLADNALLKPTGDFTIGCWFKTSVSSGGGVIFQSAAAVSVFAGIVLATYDEKVRFTINYNTGTTLGADYTNIDSTNTFDDSNWHYVVITFKNNWAQLYVDSKLQGSGYSKNPAYQATNYVRIGCQNNTGSNMSFFTGQIDDLFLINGYALDEETIRAKYQAGTAQGTGSITVTKKFILTNISYSSPNTTLTMYGGTDFALSNRAISNPFYSMVEQPFGFNRNPDKWSVIVSNPILLSQSSPVTGTYYNIGSISLSIPIGQWKVRTSHQIVVSGSSYLDSRSMLSLWASTELKLICQSSMNSVQFGSNFMEVEDSIVLNNKATYYLIHQISASLGTNTSIALRNDYSPSKIIATSVYL